MTDITPEETILHLQFQINGLKNQLTKTIRERDEAIYDKEVSEWALVGIVQSRAHVKIVLNTTPADDLMRLAEALGRNAALKLLHDAGLAFKAHAEMFEMRQHIHYMENHGGLHGVQFTPWKDTELTAERNASYWAWPYHKSFGGPKEAI